MVGIFDYKNNDTDNTLKKDENNNDSRWIKVCSFDWQPEVGDSIQGELIEKKFNLGQFKQTLYIIKEDSGQKIDVWGRTQLDNLMMNVDVGDYIRITFNGTRKTEENRKMYVYNVEKRI